MKIPRKKLKKKLEKITGILGEKAFLIFVILFLLSLIFGSIIFYQKVILTDKKSPEITGSQIQFKEKEYEKVLQTWQEREKKFNEADSRQYPNPFLAATTTGLTPH